MKIGIDVSQIIFGTGVSTYTRNLVSNLLKIDKQDTFVLFGGSLRRFGELKKYVQKFTGDKAVAKIFPYPPILANFVWNNLHILPVENLIGQVDVLHTSDWTEPPSAAFKVTMVHDLIPLRYPKMIHKKILETYVKKLSLVKKESRLIIVPSLATKVDLTNYGVSDNKIVVIPEAGEGKLQRASQKEIAKAKLKYKTSNDYLVAFASAPYKNVERTIRAYELSSAGKNIKLVLVGRPTVGNFKNRRNIRVAGYVETDDLAALISGSRGLIYASVCEGFGQPILEGFACGVPVVTSNISSMPEVAGGAAILVDPFDINSITEGIEKALRGPRAYILKGERRLKDFSWEKTAKMTLEVYRKAKM